MLIRKQVIYMFDALKHILSGQHQFASDGLLLMLVGATSANAPEITLYRILISMDSSDSIAPRRIIANKAQSRNICRSQIGVSDLTCPASCPYQNLAHSLASPYRHS